jgi:cation transport regulator ChaC
MMRTRVVVSLEKEVQRLKAENDYLRAAISTNTNTDSSRDVELWDTCRVDSSHDYEGVNLIFGYGSLCWKPPVPADKIIRAFPAFTDGFFRRFWQYSVDHRGVPGAPGLVATLLAKDHPDVFEEPPETTLGMVYEVDLTPDLLTDLDFRERNGYTRTLTTVTSTDTGESHSCIVYFAVNDGHDVAYAGPLAMDTAGKIIATSIGPSGRNVEYFKNLIEFMNEANAEDSYLRQLDEAVDRHLPQSVPINL